MNDGGDWPDWYLATSLRAVAYLICTHEPNDATLLRWWRGYALAAPPAEVDT